MDSTGEDGERIGKEKGMGKGYMGGRERRAEERKQKGEIERWRE